MSSSFSDGKIPGMEAMNEGLSFVKNLWGGMQMPGMVTPTVSLEELDKKIKDLKTVETWLNVNMNMLRGTIQAMEVQRATVAALQSIGDSFAENMAKHSANLKAAAPSASPATSAGKKPATAASTNAMPATPGNNATWPMPQTSTKNEPAPASPHSLWPTAQTTNEKPVAEPLPQATAVSAATTAPTATTENSSEHPQASNVPFTNPAAWWNLLQDQFKQAVSNAVAEDSVSGAAEHAASVTAATTSNTKTTEPAKTTSSAKPAKDAGTGYLDDAKAIVKPRNKARVNLTKAPPALTKTKK